MESLPDKSIVVSVAAPMKYMSGSTFTWNPTFHNTQAHPNLIRYIVCKLSFCFR